MFRIKLYYRTIYVLFIVYYSLSIKSLAIENINMVNKLVSLFPSSNDPKYNTLYSEWLVFIKNNSTKKLNNETRNKAIKLISSLKGYVLYPIVIYDYIILNKNNIDLVQKEIDYIKITLHNTSFAKEVLNYQLKWLYKNGNYNSIVENYKDTNNIEIKCINEYANIKINKSNNETINLYEKLMQNRITKNNFCLNFIYLFNEKFTETSQIFNTKLITEYTLYKENINVLSRIKLSEKNVELFNFAKNINSSIFNVNILQNKKEIDYKKILTNNFFIAYKSSKNINIKDYIDRLKYYKISRKKQHDLVVSYIKLNFNKINNSTLDKLLKEYPNNELIEKRIRIAIRRKEKLVPFINLLSDDFKKHQEWRYWKYKELIKSKLPDIHKLAKKQLIKLSNEIGFYPILASELLGNKYKLNIKDNNILIKLNPDKIKLIIDELKKHNRHLYARYIWNILDINKEKYPEYIMYAYKNNWYDLGVAMSIKLGERNNIQLRFPNAYQKLYLNETKNKLITKTFAQAIARQESGWRPDVESNAKAIGLMQLLPSTAKEVANKHSIQYKVNMLYEYSYNLKLGTLLLNDLLNTFENNRIFAAIAYNAGSSRVKKWLSISKGNLSMDEFIATIPFNETRNYVQNTITFDLYNRYIQKYNNKEPFTVQEKNRKY